MCEKVYKPCSDRTKMIFTNHNNFKYFAIIVLIFENYKFKPNFNTKIK